MILAKAIRLLILTTASSSWPGYSANFSSRMSLMQISRQVVECEGPHGLYCFLALDTKYKPDCRSCSMTFCGKGKALHCTITCFCSERSSRLRRWHEILNNVHKGDAENVINEETYETIFLSVSHPETKNFLIDRSRLMYYHKADQQLFTYEP